VERSRGGFHRIRRGFDSLPVKSRPSCLKSFCPTRNGILFHWRNCASHVKATSAKITSGISFQIELGLECVGPRENATHICQIIKPCFTNQHQESHDENTITPYVCDGANKYENQCRSKSPKPMARRSHWTMLAFFCRCC